MCGCRRVDHRGVRTPVPSSRGSSGVPKLTKSSSLSLSGAMFLVQLRQLHRETLPREAGLPGRGGSRAAGPRSSGPPHGGHTGLVPGSGEERCLRAAGSTHIWRHSELFSPVNTKTSERASAAVVTYYVALIGCRSIQLSEEAFYFLVRLKHAP